MERLRARDRQGGAHPGAGADDRRVGHRARSSSPTQSTASPRGPARPLREGELRRHPLGAHRERALRPREGRLHGRRTRGGAASSSWRTAARCFLDEIGDMSLAAQAKVLRALQTGRDHPRRLGARLHGGRAGDRRHQQGPAGGGAPRAASARTSSSASTWCRSARRRCGSGSRTSRCSPSASCSWPPGRTACARSPSTRRCTRGSLSSPGPATCASCATSASGWPS